MSADILVVGPSWVGDMVMAQALFRRLQALAPDAAIDVLAPAWSLPLIARMPEVRAGIEMPLGHGEFAIGRRYLLGRGLRGRYQRAIVLPNSWKSALVPLFARIPHRTGYARELRYGLLNDLRRLDRRRLPTTAAQFVALAESSAPAAAPPIPVPQLRTDPRRGAQLLTGFGLDPQRPAYALLPGAEYGPAKRWPAERYAELARRLAAGGAQVWVLGSAKERELAQAVAGDIATAHNLAGRTRLEDVVDLLARARAAITNDSGLMHVAAAVGIPLVAVYGSSDPRHTPPLSQRASIVYLGLSCSPCFARECPLGHLNCLRGVTVERVMAELAALKAYPPSRSGELSPGMQ
ncbi:MAG: lipopolysaccharide heptosyltransferase II [Gammaproteobacteria bacterium]|nr:lipopolysaccharide heptosyltransferase II [Gammaproteobacteria bacterium]